ncbi:MAG: Gfo/Idh/MocA family oxidoreductase [Bryobacterales bacterium]|nr:Gfo/Idh/MocA family oxidoreductase [Bryobacterales bacterium]
MTRRTLLGSLAASTASTAAGAAAAAGAASTTAAVTAAGDRTKPIRTAIYGIGHAHAFGKLAALKAMPQFEVVGICEPDSTVPRNNKALDGVRWLTQREIVDDPTIEFIAVESRVRHNLQYAREAISANRFVHLDKAPGNDLPALKALLTEAGRRNRVVQMGYQWRYHPAMQAAIEAARKGWLGEVYSFRARIDKPTPAEDRRYLAEFRGGMMFELGCHLIDRATDLLGKPTRVTGHLFHHASQDDALADNTLAILEYPKVLAEISVAAMHPQGNAHRTIEITGTNGSAIVRPFSPYRLAMHLKDAAGPYPGGLYHTEFPPDRLAYAADFGEMARIIREGVKPTYAAAHDLMTHEVLLQACHQLTV